MVTDNYNYDRCHHADYVKGIVIKKGYKNVEEQNGKEKKVYIIVMIKLLRLQ